jgi:integrase
VPCTSEARSEPRPEERVTFREAAERYVHHVEHVLKRKTSTVQDYQIMVRRHLAPHFRTSAIDRITADDVAAYIASKSRAGLAVKTITNHLNFARGVFQFAVKRGWASTNPVAMADRPRVEQTDPDIHFLNGHELEALLRTAQREDTLGPTDYALYMTAAMTGLRQGELAALRWRDVYWPAGIVRVRRNYSRGVGDAEVAPLKPRGADGRSSGGGAGAPLPAFGLQSRRRAGVLPSPHRQPLRCLQPA